MKYSMYRSCLLGFLLSCIAFGAISINNFTIFVDVMHKRAAMIFIFSSDVEPQQGKFSR